jgi:hypothetical protein
MVIRIVASALFTLAAAALVEAGPKCDPLPVLQIFDVRTTVVGDSVKTDRVIDGTATKDFEPLRFVLVRLYAGKKVVRQSTTDAQGHFVLENLPLGRYTLSFQIMGNFRIEVTPPRFPQQDFYEFSSIHGCLGWGFNSD